MTDLELQAEGLTVLPLRLETITVKGGDVTQKSWLDQTNFNNQIGGDCKLSNCDQWNFQSNWADVDQDVDYEIEVEDVIEDNRKLFQSFGVASTRTSG
jgi:hypothetical protein